MKKITKKDIKQIREGNHSDMSVNAQRLAERYDLGYQACLSVLMDCFDFLLDSYEEDKYDLGYQDCLSDMSVNAQRLAERIAKHIDKPYKPDDVKTGELAKVIENFFNETLNK